MPDTADRPTLLEAVDLTRRDRRGRLVLDAVSLAIRAGEIYCLAGTAAAGKTLLIHTCLGLVRPTGGQVLVAGFDVAREPLAARRHATYVPRGAPLYASLTARENVQFFTEARGSGERLRRSDYYDAMRRVSIPEHCFDRPAGTLGEAVRVATWLAIGLLTDTSLLLLDEPTTGLDLSATADLQAVLDDFRKRGKAVLIATSDVLFAGGIADRAGILKEGRKRVELSRREFAGRSLPELYLDYLGRPLTFPRTRQSGGPTSQ